MTILTKGEHFSIIERVTDDRTCGVSIAGLTTIVFGEIEKILELNFASGDFDFVVPSNVDGLLAVKIRDFEGKVIGSVGQPIMIVRGPGDGNAGSYFLQCVMNLSLPGYSVG